MARYIDAEALIAEFKRLTLGENSLIERVFADGVYAVIETFPTADIVPKSEADLYRKQVDELEDELASTYDKLEEAEAEVERLHTTIKMLTEPEDIHERYKKCTEK